MDFKKGVDFARILSIGAYVADTIPQDLEHNDGHHIIELDTQSQVGIATLWAKNEDWLCQPDADGILDALKLQTLRR
ncbi:MULTISPECIES: hypothetical protein [Streptomyces]|uniref:Uncharacterized protein n=1 Tax=Streptomyces sudanensis TaxID=436397 RepID=A0ABY4T8E9_9ACTN|nr:MULTISPECIES: hypothetical protein [Streptomyces]URN14977.1 hypothetical protein MW084_02435 [Streptomyces sudanensis]